MRPRRLEFEIGRQLDFQFPLVAERKLLRVRLHKKVERIDNREVRRQIDFNLQFRRLLGKHNPRQPVAMRVLLPVDEMLGGRDLE